MASTFRHAAAAVIERLQDEPWQFEFFAAILWLERLQYGRRVRSPAVASSPSPEHETIHFQSRQDQVFAPSDLVQVTPSSKEGREVHWNVIVGMMGLTGSNGVLPAHYSRLVVNQLRKSARASDAHEKNRESALPDFLDMFNHRQISLFYRAWKKYRLEALYARQLDSPDAAGDDPVTTILYSLIGLATGRTDRTQALRNRNDFGDEALLYYSGAFSRWPRSPVTLKNIISEMFDMPAEVIEFQPQWSNLRPEDQYRLMPAGGPVGQKTGLGWDITIGSRICLFDARFRIRLGPLSRQQFNRMLPEGDRYRAVVQFVRLYVGAQWDFDIQLVLKAEEVPFTRLGGRNFPPSQLGRNGWMLNQQAKVDQDQVVLIPDELKVAVEHSNND